MKSSTSKIFELRKDMSDYVFHFTKGENGRETFQTIIEQRKINDISKKGYICFSESPLYSLIELFDYFNTYSKPMYCPYGFGIKKELFFAMGGRPVIYGTDDEITQLGKIGFEWRSLRYHPSEYDFSWLREWRIPTSEIQLTYENCIAVVPSVKDMEDLTMESGEIEIDAEPDDGGYTTFFYDNMKRKFKCVTLDCIRKIENMGQAELETLIAQCKEIEHVYLGSSWQ